MPFKATRLAISGSGTRYPVQIGALCELTDMGVELPEMVTTSGGTVAGAAKLALNSSKLMEQLACDVLPRDNLDPNIWPFGGTTGVFAGKKFREAFRKNLGSTVEGLPHGKLHIATSNWTRGSIVVHTKGDLPLCIGASMCLPIFDMVEINGDLYEDGGAGGANFLLDYTAWHDFVPLPMTGLTVRGVGTPVRRKRPMTKIDRAAGTIENLIAANDREHIEDANWAKVILLETKAPGLNLFMGPDEVRSMLAEGRAAVRKARLEGKLG